MKKLIFAVATVISLTTFADVKFATVDLLLLVRNHPNYDSNKELMSSTEKDYKKRLDAIKAEGEALQAEGKKLVEQVRNPMLADKAKADLEKKITDIQQKLMGIEQRYRAEGMRTQQDLQDLEGRLLKTTTEDLKKRLAKYAESKGYDFILDKNAAPYSKASFDVTQEILVAMGVDPKDAKGRNESK